MHLKQYATNFYYTHTWQQTKIYLPVTRIRSCHSSVNVVTKLLIRWLRNHGLIPGRVREPSLLWSVKTVTEAHQPLIQWVPEVLSTMGGHLLTDPHLVPKMCAAMLSIPPHAFLVGTGKTILYHKNPTAIMFMKNTYYPAWQLIMHWPCEENGWMDLIPLAFED